MDPWIYFRVAQIADAFAVRYPRRAFRHAANVVTMSLAERYEADLEVGCSLLRADAKARELCARLSRTGS